MCWGEKSDKPSNSDAGKNPPNCAKEPCPLQCKPITSIKIVSVEFLSDHKLLKDHNANWSDGGARYPKPEWTSAHQHPVSHNMDKLVDLKIIIEVSPTNACPETGDLRGEGPGEIVFEKKGITFSPGQQTILLRSIGKVPKEVNELDVKIQWSTKRTSVSISPSTTLNKMYVTYADPFGSEVTLKRLAWAVDKCKGKSDIDGIVLAAHKYINTNTPPKFNVQTNEWPADTPPIWHMLNSSHSGGSCIAHSNLLKHIANILGVPNGLLERVYSSTDDTYDSQEFPIIAGRQCTPVVVVDKGGGSYEWNYYEACLQINGKWYPGAFGEDRHPSQKEVHRAYASAPNRLVYVTMDSGPPKFFDRNFAAYNDPLSIPYAKCIPVP